MLDGQDDAIVAVAAKVELESPQAWNSDDPRRAMAGADGAGSLSGVVDGHDGDGMAALQLAQEGERRHRTSPLTIPIDAMQADERIEDEQPRPAGRRSRRGRCGRRRYRGAGWGR